MGITIDAEFRDIIPALTDDEVQRLTESLLEEGCREPIILWGETLVDGHNRYRICKQHSIQFKTIQKDFADRDDVKLWIMKNQLARRNLSDIKRISVVEKCENAIRAKARERQATSTGGTTPQLKVNLPEADKSQSRDELGAMAGVSGSTYERATKALREAPKPVRQALLNEDISINKAHEVVKASPEIQAEIAYRLENIDQEPEETNTPKKIVESVLKPHVAYNSGTNEWYTPAEYIEKARAVLKTIELDPASCEYANQTVKAKKFYSIKDDGLSHEWHGKTWMNPPYCTELIGKFIDKFVLEFRAKHITEGLVLVNNATETSWFRRLASEASAILFPAGRIKYLSPTKESYSPLQGQAILYFGDKMDRFFEVFTGAGILCKVVHFDE